MVYVVGILKVESFDKWKEFFSKNPYDRQKSGGKEARILRNLDDQNEVNIIFNWDTIENARKFFENKSLREALQKQAGVQNIEVKYLEEVAKTI